MKIRKWDAEFADSCFADKKEKKQMTLVYDSRANISAHFKMYEIAKSQIAARNNIDNTPPSEVLARARITAEYLLEPIRIYFNKPMSPNSWFRCEEVEKVLCWKSFERWCKKRSLHTSITST